jgi:aspartate/methionine/tyrosine aminotransferase
MLLDYSKRGQALIGQEMFKVLDKALILEREGKKIYHLELGSPKHYPPGRIINKTITALLDTKVGYTSPSGLFELREGIAGYYANISKHITYKNIAISTANLLITQLIDIICNTGDEVVVFLPAFPTYLAACEYTRVKVRKIPLDFKEGFSLSKKTIDIAFKTKPKLLFVNSANNPTGAVYGAEVLQYLVSSARKNKCWVISDETYGHLSYNKHFYSLLHLDYEKLVVISSFSKIFSVPGFRIGYAIANEKTIEKISLSSSTLYSCLPIFTQEGMLQGVNILDEFAAFMNKHYKKLCRECIAILRKARNIDFVVPDSAFYIFINIENLGMDDISFCTELINDFGVAVTPGSSFGCPNFIRIAFCGERHDLKKGLIQLVKYINK